MSPTSRPRSSASRATCRLPKNPRASPWFSRTTPTCASSVTDWTIATLGREIAARQVSPVEVTRECLERVARLDGKIRSFITVDAEGALATARELEAELSAGLSRGPFHGIPLAYKDLCHVRGLPTSCGTVTREYFTSEHECTAVCRLRDGGAVTLGKLNMTELALGPFGDNAHHGDVQNPWRPGHVAGGSSSGSAAAVAAGFVLGTLGSDTGGSIRLPAACCGVDGLDGAMDAAVRAAARVLEGLGAEVVTTRVPDPRPVVDVSNVIARAESSAIHARIVRERPHELQPAVRARLEVGFHISAHDYLQALRLRARYARDFVAQVFAGLDALLAPVIPEPAPPLEAVKAGTVEEIVSRMGRFSRLTRPFNGLGLPALSVPCGFSGDGRPPAVQIVGRPFDEATVRRLGHAYERATDWGARRPALA